MRWTAPALTYVICTNPRSGSWLLSDGLASTGVAGNPREWFNSTEEQRHRARWRMRHTSDLGFADYFRQANAESTTSNGVSGIKLHFYQLVELTKRLSARSGRAELTNAQAMATTLPGAKLLWLTRRDKARQAISLQIAAGTRRWWAIDGVPNPLEGEHGEPEYDPRAIARTEAVLVDNDSHWLSFFRDYGVAPYVLSYEDLVADYPGAIRSVLQWLGISDADGITVPAPRLQRQSNARTEEWLARYLDFKKSGGTAALYPVADENVEAKVAKRIPNAWKQWIGNSKVRKTADDAIVEVLTNNGYSREAALAEVEKAGSDPYLSGAAEAYRRSSKDAAQLNALAQMARLDSRTKRIERRSALSSDEFRDNFYAANRPVIIQDLASTGWTAMDVWKPDALKSAAGDRMVDVMIGNQTDAKHRSTGRPIRTRMPFADYLATIYEETGPSDVCMIPSSEILHVPALRPNVAAVFPNFLNPDNAAGQSFLSLEPARTVTPLRHQTNNVFFVQVVGRKRYRLIPATEFEFATTAQSATVIELVVEPGEALFIPVGWLWRVRALDVSLTIAFANFLLPNQFQWE